MLQLHGEKKVINVVTRFWTQRAEDDVYPS
jgi:hypothetical protein